MSSSVTFRVRSTGELVQEPIFAENALRWFYQNPLGKAFFGSVLNNETFCNLYGWLMDRPSTARQIPEFISHFNIDASEAELPLAEYKTFNAFFERKLRPGARVFEPDPVRLPSPGDGKLLVYPSLGEDERLPIKGLAWSSAELLADPAESARFRGGAAMILRLAPYDYHRYHFPDGGTATASRRIPGRYDSVNPIAIEAVPDLFVRNKREVACLDSDHFGRLAFVDVGALMVGTIRQTYTPGRVERGQEKGHFRYGGSTVVVFFEPGRVRFDADLVEASAQGMELAVKAGEAIASATTR